VGEGVIEAIIGRGGWARLGARLPSLHFFGQRREAILRDVGRRRGARRAFDLSGDLVKQRGVNRRKFRFKRLVRLFDRFSGDLVKQRVINGRKFRFRRRVRLFDCLSVGGFHRFFDHVSIRWLSLSQHRFYRFFDGFGIGLLRLWFGWRSLGRGTPARVIVLRREQRSAPLDLCLAVFAPYAPDFWGSGIFFLVTHTSPPSSVINRV
jgi:hypothetical protein